MILQEFDPSQKAVINAEDFVDPIAEMPETAVACYSRITMERMVEELGAKKIASTSTANGETYVYRAAYKGKEIALFMIDVGAPMSVAMLEEVFAMGVRNVIVFGTCGVLDREIEDCSILIPNQAIRDEGTSYHYAPAENEIEVNGNYLGQFTDLLYRGKGVDNRCLLPGDCGKGKTKKRAGMHLCGYGMFRQCSCSQIPGKRTVSVFLCGG